MHGFTNQPQAKGFQEISHVLRYRHDLVTHTLRILSGTALLETMFLLPGWIEGSVGNFVLNKVR